ncbi:MAG: hypothetical protein R2861_10245 [Desulfobacterales bacterium]
MDKKYGVYICTGCGIGDALDIKSLSDVAEEEGLSCQTHLFLCGKEGLDLLKSDISEKGGIRWLLRHARRVNYDVFRFDGCSVDRVNLREGVVCASAGRISGIDRGRKEDEENYDRVQMMAEDYLRMGMAKIEKVKLLNSYQVENFTKKNPGSGRWCYRYDRGIDAAAAGYEVTIIEKNTQLGGNVANWRQQLPTAPPYENLIPTVVAEKLQPWKRKAKLRSALNRSGPDCGGTEILR